MSENYSTTSAVALRAVAYHIAFITALSIVLLVAGARLPGSRVTAGLGRRGCVVECPAVSVVAHVWAGALTGSWAMVAGVIVVLVNSAVYAAVATTAMVGLRRYLNGRLRTAAPEQLAESRLP